MQSHEPNASRSGVPIVHVFRSLCLRCQEYPTDRGAHELCDLLAGKVLKSRPIPLDHSWSPVTLRLWEASAVLAFIERILELHASKLPEIAGAFLAGLSVNGAASAGQSRWW